MDRIILENKLRPPDCERMVERKRLLEPVIESSARLTSICADAGFGKTIFMAQLHARLPGPGVWYRLEDGDRDPAMMLSYLIAGINRQVPGFCMRDGDAAPGRTPGTLGTGDLVDLFTGDFQEYVAPPFNIFLDDFHTINDTNASLDIVQLLIKSLPGGVRFFICSRSRLELPLSQLRAGEDIIDIGAEELRFTNDEINDFFSGTAARTVGREVMRRILEGTEGWPAALALVKNQLHRCGIKGGENFVPAVFRDIKEYLAEEVWLHLDDDLKRFLMRNSLLDVMEPEICSAVTPGGRLSEVVSRRLLESAAGSNILVDRLGDGDEYRAHALFRDFLRQELRKELGREEIIDLHRRYAAFYEAKGLTVRAAGHYIEAALTDELARLMEEQGEKILMSGQIISMSRWLDHIPADLFERRPWLCYFKARVLDRDKNQLEAARLLSIAQRGFVESGDHHGLYLFALAFSEILLNRGDYQEAIDITASAVEYAVNRSEKMAALSRIALSYTFMGRAHEAIGFWSEARDLCDEAEAGDRLQIEVSLLSAKFFTGDFRGILAVSKKLLRDLGPGTQAVQKFIVVSYRVLALFESGRYLEARELLERSGEIIGEEYRSRERFLDILQARTMLYDGRARQGRRIIMDIVADCETIFLLGPDVPLVYLGNYDRQKRLFDKALEQHLAARELCGEGRVYPLAGCLANIGADRQRLVNGSSREGLEELDAAETLAVQARADFVLAQVKFHRAWRALAQGEEELALGEIGESLGLAARNGYDHFISREGRISLELLTFAFARGVEREYLVHIFGLVGGAALSPIALLLQTPDPVLREATVRALAAAGGLSAVPRIQRMLRDGDDRVRSAARSALESIREAMIAPEEMLTRREHQVLELLAEGATNLEIAERLVITLPTVKSHVSSIFRKLGVGTRVQAAMYYNESGNGAGGITSQAGGGAGRLTKRALFGGAPGGTARLLLMLLRTGGEFILSGPSAIL